MMTNAKSLYGEIITALVLCGLILFSAGWLMSASATAQSSIQLIALATIVIGSAVFAMSLMRFRSRLQATGAVEIQLASLKERTDSLQPIVANSMVGRGWNQLVERVADRDLDDSIERRLQQNVSSRRTEQFARAIRSLSEGVAVTDAEGKITYVNPAWMGLMVDTIDEELLIGSTVSQCLTERAYTNWDEEVKAISQGSKPISIALNLGLSVHDGVHQVRRLPLEGRTGESAGFVWTLKDVTQSSIAKESHEQFLASATHELRTPLTNIRAYTESLLTIDDVTPEQQKEFYNVIHSEAGRLGRLLNELLDIQQLEAGSMTLQVANFDIQRMVHEVQEQLNPLLNEKKLNFVCRIAPDLKSIMADKEKVTSCLINLLGNAVKYTPEGGEVKLIAERHESTIVLNVVDSGIGIAEHELPKIFERFYRCEDERVAGLEGNGLGLAFCMEVARLHGGELTVESKLNEGSKFMLHLPFDNQE
ncbi:MAG: sensor histidine kinase [Aureliella sp.]